MLATWKPADSWVTQLASYLQSGSLLRRRIIIQESAIIDN